jgi:hypothetical protein
LWSKPLYEIPTFIINVDLPTRKYENDKTKLGKALLRRLGRAIDNNINTKKLLGESWDLADKYSTL